MNAWPIFDSPPGRPRFVEGVDVVLEERKMQVHARAVVLLEWFRHERRVDAVLEGDLFDRQARGHDGVGHRQRIGISGDDLMLAGCHFVMGVLDRDAHLLERIDRVSPVVLRHVERRQVEIAAVVEHFRLGPGVPEVEELELRGGVEVVPHLGGPAEVSLEDYPRIARKRLAIRGCDVAKHPGHLLLRAPGKDAEGRGIGSGQHVGLLDAGVAVDGRPIEGHALLERHLQFCGADRDRLEEPLDVGEPEPDESDPTLLDGAHDIFGLLVHANSRVG